MDTICYTAILNIDEEMGMEDVFFTEDV